MLVVTVRTVYESYVTPTRFSRFVEKYVPGLYNPPPEIFYERYRGAEMPSGRAEAVVGPDCSKTVILPGKEGSPSVTVPEKCSFTASNITQWVAEQAKL
ncbi:hypothetical protein MXD81_22905, partial [Microbacteriaceae bacterium K1510]|nr:hypothetical protein [Microbacteriaceae bacterium K1510]